MCNLNSFCLRLKELRKEKDCSQKQVAEFLGIAPSTYANWEQGRTQPGIEDIYKLLKFFEVSANELFALL